MKKTVIDVSSMSEEGTKNMKSFVYDSSNTGDRLRLRADTVLDGKPSGRSILDAVIVKDGTFVETSCPLTKNVLLPFEGNEDVQQKVILGTSQYFTEISWDPEPKSMLVDGEPVYLVQSDLVGGRRMAVAKRSVILVFEASPVQEFLDGGLQPEDISNKVVTAVVNQSITEYNSHGICGV